MVTNCSFSGCSALLCLNYLLPLSSNGHLARHCRSAPSKGFNDVAASSLCGLLRWFPVSLSVVDFVVNLAQITCQAAVIFTTMTSFGSEQSYQNPQVVGCRLVFCGLWSNDIWFYNVTNLFCCFLSKIRMLKNVIHPQQPHLICCWRQRTIFPRRCLQHWCCASDDGVPFQCQKREQE